MRIGGYQPLTLIDYPKHLAAMIFTVGCNMRCPYCHNPELISGHEDLPVYTTDSIIARLRSQRPYLSGVVISGGEPTLYADLEDLMVLIKGLGYSIKLDTNGSQPKRLRSLLKSGLVDYVAMDVKSSPQHYAKACGIHVDVDRISESIQIIQTSGIDFHFRTTTVKPLCQPDDIIEILRWIKIPSPYILQAYKVPSYLKNISKDHLVSFKQNEFDQSQRLVKMWQGAVPSA